MNNTRGPLSMSLDETGPEAFGAYSFDSGSSGQDRIGVLVLHGFTGAPTSVARWAREFADAGYSVRLPLLPGHGTTPEDMSRSTRAQWIAAVDDAYQELAATCSQVFVAGLSMGGALALQLAAHRRVAGVMLVNPGLAVDRKLMYIAPVVKYAVPFLDSIGDDIARPGVSERAYEKTPLASVAQLVALFSETRKCLPAIDVPVVAFISDSDNVVSPRSLAALEKGLRPGLLRVVRLPRSRHVATMDYDAELIFDRSVDFVREISAS